MLPDRFEAASRRFKAFFEELGRVFVEREDVLTQVALALLSREHALMTGPPGTAKSNIASSVLRRVIDEQTGEPSLFSRQFTESTVQTDLVGPINFKTLMESGRTEHFTDEGMLGAVHAFLDEVFDGRDMLLRSTLNVLQERELKQGAKTTHGRIECALMTTNRYLAEVLAGSRETLLAFVDRIAFVSFVPRGFASSNSMNEILKAQLGGGPAQLRSVLTIQDLDALQAATDDVWVSDPICEAIVKLVEGFDEELAAAERADNTFVATRYVSTRAVVRLGKILRAVAVYNRIFHDPSHPFEVLAPDLGGARYGLLLCGPPPNAIKTLLAKETDPRERRQLAIVRTEREIFDRVLAKIPRVPRSPRPTSKPLETVRTIATDASKQETTQLVEATRALAVVADARDGDEAAKLLERTIRELSERALKRGLVLGISSDASLEAIVRELADLAHQVEASGGQGRIMARWLRGRAVGILDEAANALVPGAAASIENLGKPATGLDDVRDICERCLASLESIATMREGLRAGGAEIADAASSDRAWHVALENAESDIAVMLDSGFRAEMQRVMTTSNEMSAVLDALATPIGAIAGYQKRLAALGIGARLDTLVIAPRIKPLVAAAFGRITAVHEGKLLADVDALLGILARAGLEHAIAPKDLLGFTAAALVRTMKRPSSDPLPKHDRAGYRALREERKVPAAFTLLELALRLSPAPVDLSPQGLVVHVQTLAQTLPEDVARSVAAIDLERLERTATFLERWWASVAGTSLESISTSGFFQIAIGERALFRFTLESRLVADVFPSVANETADVRGRIEALREKSEGEVRGLLRKRSDEDWAAMLKSF